MEYRDNSPKIALPYIENPVVEMGKLTMKACSEESVSGFTEAPSMRMEYNYEYCRYHWVGNGHEPTVRHTYYACFSAMVSGATCMEVKDTSGTRIAETVIEFTEEVKKTPVIKITREGAAYGFSKLTFVVKNDSGIEARIDWTNGNTSGESENLIIESVKSSGCTENMWEYPLERLVWSLTSHCNLNCRHCGFRDIHNNIIELNGSQIRCVVKDIIQLGVPDVTLSGGEILLSPYWYETAETLSRAGVTVSLITNGTLIDGDTAAKIKDAGVTRVAVSIDDLREQSDTIREGGSYAKAVEGIKLLKAANVPVSIVTTVNALNLHSLDEMRSAFTELGVDAWGLKPILPIGEAERNPELWLDERDINEVIDFCYLWTRTPGVPVVPALAFEMHTKKGAAVLRHLYGEDVNTGFYGSDAGIFSAQLHPNGGLVGVCMCSPAHSAGNVKERSLVDIWQDKQSFKALREFDPSMLSGYCEMCDRRDTCKGGDLNTRLAFGGINSENKFCAYRNSKLYGITI